MTKQQINALAETTRAAYIAGLFDGLANMSTARQRRLAAVRLQPFAETARQVAFGGGAFNPILIWEMLAEFERLTKDAT